MGKSVWFSRGGDGPPHASSWIRPWNPCVRLRQLGYRHDTACICCWAPAPAAVIHIGADFTGATGNFAPVLTQEPGQTLRFAPVPFMTVLWFFKWMLQLYLLNLTKGATFAGSVGHPMTKMLSASGGFCPQTAIIGSCSALAMVPPQPLTPSAAYESNWTLPRYLKPKVRAYGCMYVCHLTHCK